MVVDLARVPASPPATASSASKPTSGDPPHVLTHRLLRDLIGGIQQISEYVRPAPPTEQQPALVLENVGAGTVTSTLLRREGPVVIVEVIGSGAGTVTILDQPHGGAPQATADSAGTRTVSGHVKYAVTGVMDAFMVQLVVTTSPLSVLIGFADAVPPEFSTDATWSITQASGANASQTLTKTAVAGRAIRVTAFEAAINAAAAVVDISVTVSDGANLNWTTFIGAGAARGTRVGNNFIPPLLAGVGNNVTLTIAAGGAAVVSQGSIAGDLK